MDFFYDDDGAGVYKGRKWHIIDGDVLCCAGTLVYAWSLKVNGSAQE